MRIIPLHGARAARWPVVMVDDRDYELVSKYRWNVHYSKKSGGGPYAITWIKHRGVLMHKMLTGYSRTDHKNGNGLDNRRENLRAATATQNNANRRKTKRPTSSRFKGVSLHRVTGRWEACMSVSNRKRHLGFYATEEEAACAYDAAASELHGEFARLNFPEETAQREETAA